MAFRDKRGTMVAGGDEANFLKVYNAISCEAAQISWQKQIIGMSALLLGQRPVRRTSRLETFMIARLRTAQVWCTVYSACKSSIC